MREHAFRSRENKKVLIARLSLVAEDAVSGEGIMARGRAG
jgi:hypothetical protein